MCVGLDHGLQFIVISIIGKRGKPNFLSYQPKYLLGTQPDCDRAAVQDEDRCIEKPAADHDCFCCFDRLAARRSFLRERKKRSERVAGNCRILAPAS